MRFIAMALVALGFCLFAEFSNAQGCNIGQAPPVRASAINNLALPPTTQLTVAQPAFQPQAAAPSLSAILGQTDAALAARHTADPGRMVAVAPRKPRRFAPDNYRINAAAAKAFAKSGATPSGAFVARR